MQGAPRPRVLGDDRERRLDHRVGVVADHRRCHTRRDRPAAVDALSVVRHRAVDRHQAGRLRGAARRVHPEGRRTHREAVAPGVPVLGGDGGGETPAEVLEGAAFAEPGSLEGALVTVGDPRVPGLLHVPDGEARAVLGEEQAREDRVLRVVRAGRVGGHEPLDAAPAFTDLGRLHVLRGRAERVTDGEAEERPAGAVPQGDRGRRGRVRDGTESAWLCRILRGRPSEEGPSEGGSGSTLTLMVCSCSSLGLCWWCRGDAQRW